MFKKTTLDNGLRIITVPLKNNQAVTVLVLVGTGSKYETKEVNGISHFLEHMYFKGTKKRPSPVQVSETLDKIGGIYNAFTSEEYTGYFAKVAFPHLETAMEWVSDIFLNSSLPEKEVEKEKGVIKEEINMRYDHPMAYVEILWKELLYGDQPAGWDIAGTKDSVSSIKRSDLLSYMKKQYVAPNTIVCVAGNIEENDVVEQVKDCFSGISAESPMVRPPVAEEQSEPRALIHNRKTDQAHIYLGARGFNISHPLKYPQQLLSIVLGGMMSSRLFVRIREKMGAAYYIATESSVDPDTGYLATRAGVSKKQIEPVIGAILEEYKKLTQEKVPEAELQKAKDYIKGKTALLLETSNAQASFFANQELIKEKILTPKQLFKKFDAVSSEEILKAAKGMFTPSGLNLAVIGPFEKEERFQSILNL